MPLITRPNRAYTIALLVFGFFLIVGAVEMALLRVASTTDASVRWVFQFVVFIESLYAAAIAVTIALRAWAPSVGRTATTALNIVLLAAFPFGTAIGIYGLWKVDKEPKAGVA
jgi:hypothetical protein